MLREERDCRRSTISGVEVEDDRDDSLLRYLCFSRYLVQVAVT